METELVLRPAKQVHFASDNNSGILPEVLAGLSKINGGHAPAYGGDFINEACQREFQKHFGKSCQAYFVFNGTGANVAALSHLLKPYEGVICTETSHLQMDECGAPETVGKTKLFLCSSRDGKLTPAEAKKHLIRKGDQHYCQPRAISIAQPTELGTVYSIEEMKALAQLAKQEGLFFHVDGSRLANACVFLNCSYKEVTTDVGVDVVSFGGTKNGLMCAEAVLFLKTELARDFAFTRKRLMQLAGKMRFIAAQFYVYLNDGLWRRTAEHAHTMALRLAQEVSEVKEVQVTQAVESNAVFIKIPKNVVARLKEKYFFYVWDEETYECRWMTSFDTQLVDVLGLVRELKEILSTQR